MIGGPNGSGKSTLIMSVLLEGGDFGEYLNADDILPTLKATGEAASREAQIIVRERRARALVEQRNHAWETVMSHPSHLDHLRKARARGFQVNVIYVATENPIVNVGRVAERMERGGHSVPPDRIVTRYARSIALLPDALLLAHPARVYDNSRDDQPFRLVGALDDDLFTSPFPYDDVPTWFRPTIDAMYANRA